MASYEGVLAGIPGLAGVLASRQNREQKSANELAKITGVLSLESQIAQRDLQAQMVPLQMAKLQEEIATSSANRQALQGINTTDPNALRRVGILTKNPALLAEAGRLETQTANDAEHATQTSAQAPITDVPVLGVGASGAPAYRSVIASEKAGEIPPEVRSAMATGQPFSIGVGASSNPAENVQKVGGLFSPLMDSPVSSVRNAAAANQGILDSSNPRVIPPSKFVDRFTQLQTQEGTIANRAPGALVSIMAGADGKTPTLVRPADAIGATQRYYSNGEVV